MQGTGCFDLQRLTESLIMPLWKPDNSYVTLTAWELHQMVFFQHLISQSWRWVAIVHLLPSQWMCVHDNDDDDDYDNNNNNNCLI